MKGYFRVVFHWGVVCLVIGLFSVTASAQERAASISFTNATVAAGLGNETYTTTTKHNLGLAWIDYNNDDWPDLFTVDGFGGASAHLYQNNADGTFNLRDDLLPPLPDAEMSGPIFADVDNDGDQDIYIFVSNEVAKRNTDNSLDGPPNILLKNLWVESGNRVPLNGPLFEDATLAYGLDDRAPIPLGDYEGYRSLTGGWIDVDRDGCIDLFVGQMRFSAFGDEGNRNRFYGNNCNETFTDQTVASGVDAGGSLWNRPTLAFIGAHLDNDLWPDMYVVNVEVPSPYHHDLIYMNDGDGTFTEVTSAMPHLGDDAGAGMGIDVADIDLDGDWDIYITDLPFFKIEEVSEGNVLYLSNGDGTWSDNSAPAAGVAGDFSWGTNFLDADNDGDEDLFVAVVGADLFYQNNGDGTFTDISEEAGMFLSRKSLGSAVADYDRDGDMDIAMIRAGNTVVLFRNDTVAPGNWLEVKLDAVESNQSAIGTLVRARAGELEMMRQVKGGSSAHSQDELLVHFGLGEADWLDELRVQWPSGVEDVWTNVMANQLAHITEGIMQPWTLVVDPPANLVIPPEGGKLIFNLEVTNNTAAVAQTQLWYSLQGPRLNKTKRPVNITVNPGQTFKGKLRIKIPEKKSAGSYEVKAFLGSYPDGDFGKGFTIEKAASNAVAAKEGEEVEFSFEEVSQDEESAQPTAFLLSQNYPNPFNPTTQFVYGLEETGPVLLSVFDALGREMAVLAEGIRTAGRHAVRWHAGDAPSGVYLYRLEAGGRVETRTMLLVK